MEYWLQGGLRPRKLILGIPTYGRGFTLEGQFYGQQRPPAKAGSSAGQFTGEAGFLAYHEVRLRVVYNACKKKVMKTLFALTFLGT